MEPRDDLPDRFNPVYRPAAAFKGRYRILYGGAGSGKSVFVAQDLIKRAGESNRRILVIRKVFSTCRKSTFQNFCDIIGALGRRKMVEINKSEMEIRFPSGGSILHVGLDDAEKIKSIAGITDAWVEEATELVGEDLAQIDLRLRGLVDNPQITITFNPVSSARKIFEYVGIATASLPDRGHIQTEDVYVQHTTYLDNRWVGANYVKVFQRIGGVMQEVYEHGRLGETDEPDQVIPWQYVKRAFELDPEKAEHDGKQRLAIDVARFGNDETVFQYFKGWVLKETTAFHGQDTHRTSTLAELKIRERAIPAELVGIDVVGVGSGVADNLRAQGLKVRDVISGASPVKVPEWSKQSPDFNNLRSQMWFFGRDMMAAGRVAIAITDADAKRKLQEDLLAPRYRIGQDKRLEVEPKDGRASWGVKQRLGRSTDYADPFLYGLFVEHIRTTFTGVIGTIKMRQVAR